MSVRFRRFNTHDVHYFLTLVAIELNSKDVAFLIQLPNSIRQTNHLDTYYTTDGGCSVVCSESAFNRVQAYSAHLINCNYCLQSFPAYEYRIMCR